MTSKPVAFLLADLGVTKTHNRPYTSTDNPYSEAQFKTLKYRPGFPARFDSIEHARAFCREFFDWYNHEHRHSGIGLMTPATVHHGRAEQTHADRASVLDAAYAATPERFVRRPPRPPRCRPPRGSTSPTARRPLTKFATTAVSIDLTGSAVPATRKRRFVIRSPRGVGFVCEEGRKRLAEGQTAVTGLARVGGGGGARGPQGEAGGNKYLVFRWPGEREAGRKDQKETERPGVGPAPPLPGAQRGREGDAEKRQGSRTRESQPYR